MIIKKEKEMLNKFLRQLQYLGNIFGVVHGKLVRKMFLIFHNVHLRFKNKYNCKKFNVKFFFQLHD